jgi:TRAP-type mannitol/chloroaromatic compound transport system permease small subunit
MRQVCLDVWAFTQAWVVCFSCVYVCVWCTLAIIITMIFAKMLPVHWYVYVCMYAIDNRFELQERKKKKGRFGISHSFNHHRSASIIILLKFYFLFYFNCMFRYVCEKSKREGEQSDADLSIMASSMSCPLPITKEIVLCRLASPTNQIIYV